MSTYEKLKKAVSEVVRDRLNDKIAPKDLITLIDDTRAGTINDEDIMRAILVAYYIGRIDNRFNKDNKFHF